MSTIFEPLLLTRAELFERIQKSKAMISAMCASGRCPRMTVPASDNEYNEDVYICNTLREAERQLRGDSDGITDPPSADSHDAANREQVEVLEREAQR